eukprot:TRINITY_DN15875_c0_g1_i2.p1 TRINITY_DN15875_c0_g1~~TRINITY_DN15875_c0_g1_i2.p1  ORF type:complete len:362 (+),score=73.51 TRINITY_DN15875_c0_g1_i2:38-1087(+)
MFLSFFFFFFKQKTAYEMQRGLVGSEMCIRDRIYKMEKIPTIEEILINPDNKMCSECFSSPVTAVSLNNGIFLCSNCEAIHIEIGPPMSQVRNLSQTTLDSRELLFLTNGGNTSFNKFLETYQLNAAEPRAKFRTRAVDFYRRNLRSLVDSGKSDLTPPDIIKGQELLSDKDLMNSESNISDKKNIGKFDKALGAVKGFGKTAGEKIKNAGLTIASGGKKAGVFVASKTKAAALKVWSIKDNEKVKGAATATKQGFMKAGSAIKGVFTGIFGKKKKNEELHIDTPSPDSQQPYQEKKKKKKKKTPRCFPVSFHNETAPKKPLKKKNDSTQSQKKKKNRSQMLDQQITNS